MSCLDPAGRAESRRPGAAGQPGRDVLQVPRLLVQPAGDVQGRLGVDLEATPDRAPAGPVFLGCQVERITREPRRRVLAAIVVVQVNLVARVVIAVVSHEGSNRYRIRT